MFSYWNGSVKLKLWEVSQWNTVLEEAGQWRKTIPLKYTQTIGKHLSNDRPNEGYAQSGTDQ